MICIEGGTFDMGSNEGISREKPVHAVTVPDFYLCKYPVTQELWEAVMGENPAYFKGANRPVEQVSWNTTQQFLRKLYGITGQKYRLPTEAEWEYAARGGKHALAPGEGQGGAGFQYAGSNKLKKVVWYDENSHGETKPVGLKKPNELGLYDTSGNVLEWCEDVWHGSYEGAPNDGSAWLEGGDKDSRMVRGGSWFNDDDFCRVSYRFNFIAALRNFIIGFRLAGY